MSIIITNSVGNKFVFSGVDNVQDRNTTANIEISAPNKTPEDSVVINMSGMKRFISFDFKLIDNGVDKSLGTHSSTVITKDEQYDYIKNTLLTGKVEEEYSININGLINLSCMVNDQVINMVFANNVSYYQASIQLIVGKNPFVVTS